MSTVSLHKEARMATPVYLLVLGKGYTEAYYRLSEEERETVGSSERNR
jgi:hypothetical protein